LVPAVRFILYARIGSQFSIATSEVPKLGAQMRRTGQSEGPECCGASRLTAHLAEKRGLNKEQVVELEKQLEIQFKDVQKAFFALGDENNRAAYDRYGPQAFEESSSSQRNYEGPRGDSLLDTLMGYSPETRARMFKSAYTMNGGNLDIGILSQLTMELIKDQTQTIDDVHMLATEMYKSCPAPCPVTFTGFIE
jgi:hypothetical protein